MQALVDRQNAIRSLIANTIDMSNEDTRRLRVFFTNGYALSIIYGQYTYGVEEGLFEIAPINLEGELDGSLFDEDDQGDNVLGHCDIEKLNHYMRKLAYLPGGVQ